MEDADTRLGYGKTNGLVFGYKLHVTSSTGSLIVPLSAELTTPIFVMIISIRV